MYKAKNYDYDLREELIAQVPISNRDRSRLLFVERSNDSLSDHHFFDLPRLLKPGDLLVVNNARVVPAKLFGRKESGGTIEILVLEHPDSDDSLPGTRWCLLKSSKFLSICKSHFIFVNLKLSSTFSFDDLIFSFCFPFKLSIFW